jgi:hypothetical protein
MAMLYPLDIQRRVEERWVSRMKLAEPDPQGFRGLARPTARQQTKRVRQDYEKADPTPNYAALEVYSSAITGTQEPDAIGAGLREVHPRSRQDRRVSAREPSLA